MNGSERDINVIYANQSSKQKLVLRRRAFQNSFCCACCQLKSVSIAETLKTLSREWNVPNLAQIPT